jgi:hypothetical protein
MKRLLIAGLLMCAGCADDKLCADHRKLRDAKTASAKQEFTDVVDKKAAAAVGFARIMSHEKPSIPHSDCPECDKLIARYLMTH